MCVSCTSSVLPLALLYEGEKSSECIYHETAMLGSSKKCHFSTIAVLPLIVYFVIGDNNKKKAEGSETCVLLWASVSFVACSHLKITELAGKL